MRTRPDYINGNAGRGFKKYIGVRKYLLHNHDGLWTNTNLALSQKEGTEFIAEAVGFAANEATGVFKVTWYLSFKHLRRVVPA